MESIENKFLLLTIFKLIVRPQNFKKKLHYTNLRDKPNKNNNNNCNRKTRDLRRLSCPTIALLTKTLLAASSNATHSCRDSLITLIVHCMSKRRNKNNNNHESCTFSLYLREMKSTLFPFPVAQSQTQSILIITLSLRDIVICLKVYF